MSMGPEYDTPEHLLLDRRDTYADAAIGAVVLHRWVTSNGVIEIATKPHQLLPTDAVTGGEYLGVMRQDEARAAADALQVQLETSY